MRVGLSIIVGAGLLFSPTADARTFAVLTDFIIANAVGSMVAEQRELQCMSGIALPDAEAERIEALGPSAAAMLQYFTAAQTGSAKSAAFHPDARSRIVVGGASSGARDLDRTADPLAADGHSLAEPPLRFFRAGDGGDALGQWAVRDRSGAAVGAYTVLFVRKSGAWKLRSLTVSRADDRIEPATGFCHEPGDVTTYRLASTKTAREKAEKRLARAHAKLAKAPKAQGEAERLAADVAEKENLLVMARAAEEGAVRTARDLETSTIVGRDAMSLALGG